jgi:regulator of cell morphogenesis and NO signaling
MPDNSYLFTQVMQRYTPNSFQANGYFNDIPLQEGHSAFLSALLRSFEEKTFCASEFDPFPIEIVVDYIQRTHGYYLQKKLPEIEQSILLLSGLYTSSHPILAALQNFFRRYCLDLTTHINEEEKDLLPYIVLMRNAAAGTRFLSEYVFAAQQYSIARFLNDHHDTEDELRDIRDTIRLYQPPVTNESLYRILLSQLEAFELDLHVHAHMEESVLIPKALTIETELNGQLQRIAISN